MKIALLAEQLRQEVPGGIGTYVRGLLGGLRDLGALGPEVEIVASRGPRPDPLGALAEQMGMTLHATALPHRLQMQLWDRGIGTLGAGCDVVHRTSLAGPARSPRPSTVLIHDLAWRAEPSLTTPRGRRWHEAALDRAIASSAVLLTPSSQVADALEAAGVAPSRIHVVGEGADHLPQPDRERTGACLAEAGVEGPFFLSVSTLEPRKNLAGLLTAYRQAESSLPLVVVGPKGWGEEITPVEGVHLVGAQPAEILAGLYEQCAGFCYVPWLEGFGLPPLEAAHHGAPLIVSTEVPSIVGLEGNWSVAPGDTAGITEALRAVGEGGEAVESARAHARTFAAQHRWVDSARRHVEIWEHLS